MVRARAESDAVAGGMPAVVSPTRRTLTLTSVRSSLRTRAVLEPFGIWVLTRVLMVALTYTGVILFGNALHDPQHPSFLHALLPAWANARSHGWDTQWYTDIARRGYDWSKSVGTSPTAFFPLYPLLIRLGVILTHRSYLGVALAISNLCFLGALSFLWRLTAWEFDREVAGRTILYIAVFPTALFFFAGYSESLFLLLSVASFYYLRRRDWLLAGLLGALASATRVTGILLLVPFLYEYARYSNFSWRKVDARGLIGLALVPMGLVAFMVYLRATVGDAFAFGHYQAAWQKVFTLRLWAGTVESIRQILIVQPWASFFEVHNVINLTALVLFLASTLLVARRLPAAYALYLAAFWCVTLTSPAIANGYPVPLISMSRYVVTLFPVFMVWGLVGSRGHWHDVYLILATAFLAVFTVQFLIGGWII
ncbi:MAG TPA: mannosyltransferase family protein [Chloroflexota bacterium]